MGTVVDLDNSTTVAVVGSDNITLAEEYTHHKITVRGPSGINIAFKPFGADDYDDSAGEIEENGSELFFVGPSIELEVTTVVPGASVTVMILSW